MLDPHAVLDAGYQAARDWPSTFHALLMRLRDQAEQRGGRFGVRKEFGPLMDWAVTLDPDRPLGDLVWHELRAFALAHSDLPTRSPRLARDQDDMTGALTLAAAAHRLGRSITRVREVLFRHGLLAASPGRGSPAPVKRAGIDAILADLSDLRDKRALTQELGCGRKILDAIIAADALRPAVGPAAELGGSRCWRASDAVALVATLEHAPVLGKEAGVPFAKALLALRQHAFAPAEAAHALISGALVPIGVDPTAAGLARIRFPTSGLARLIEKGPPTRTEPTDLTIPEAATALGLKEQVAYGLCSAGIIRTVQRTRQRRVQTAEIIRFQQEFVVPSKLEAGSGGRRGWIAATLLDAGAIPVSGPRLDGKRQYVFRRRDLDRLLPWSPSHHSSHARLQNPLDGNSGLQYPQRLDDPREVVEHLHT